MNHAPVYAGVEVVLRTGNFDGEDGGTSEAICERRVTCVEPVVVRLLEMEWKRQRPYVRLYTVSTLYTHDADTIDPSEKPVGLFRLRRDPGFERRVPAFLSAFEQEPNVDGEIGIHFLMCVEDVEPPRDGTFIVRSPATDDLVYGVTLSDARRGEWMGRVGVLRCPSLCVGLGLR